MTYKSVIAKFKKRHGIVAQTCWIANVKNGTKTIKPCPEKYIAKLKAILKEEGMMK